MPKKAVALLAVVLVLTGCDPGEDPPVRQPSPSASDTQPSETFVTSSDCPNEEAIASDISKRFPPTLVIDVDGDGVDDRISMHLDPEGTPECLAFTVVEKGTTTHSGVIEPIGPAGADPLVFGRIIGSAQIDEETGVDVVILVGAGASTQFASVFRWAGGAMVPIRVAGGDGYFAFGGSAGHLDAVDCFKESPLIVVTSAVRSGDDYKVVRRFFEPTGGRFIERPEMTDRRKLAEDELTSVPEFRSGPFATCPTA